MISFYMFYKIIRVRTMIYELIYNTVIVIIVGIMSRNILTKNKICPDGSLKLGRSVPRYPLLHVNANLSLNIDLIRTIL